MPVCHTGSLSGTAVARLDSAWPPGSPSRGTVTPLAAGGADSLAAAAPARRRRVVDSDRTRIPSRTRLRLRLAVARRWRRYNNKYLY